MIVRRIITGSLALMVVAVGLHTVAATPVTTCRDALLAGRVLPGQFPDELLIAAVADGAAAQNPAARPEIESLFRKLGADRFPDRESAMLELKQRFHDPPWLGELLNGTDDPEIRMRAQDVLKHWEATPPAEDTGVARATRQLAMWYNLPLGGAKITTLDTVRGLVNEHDLGRQRFHNALPMRFRMLQDREQQLDFLIAALGHQATHAIDCAPFLKHLDADQWRDPRLLKALQDLLDNPDAKIDGALVEQVLIYMPPDIDLGDWLSVLGRTPKRDGIIAALLVRHGERQALPAFVAALREGWDNVSKTDDRITGGGHDQFYSFFHAFTVLSLPEFTAVAPDILDAIAPEFEVDDAAHQLAYLNVVRRLGACEARTAFLKKLTGADCLPQTAIAAACELISARDLTVLPALVAALGRDEAHGVRNNFEALLPAIRRLRTVVFLDEDGADAAREGIERLVALMLEEVGPDGQLAPQVGELAAFDAAELQPFGIVPEIRAPFTAALGRWSELGTWDAGPTVFKALAADAEQRGDRDAFLEHLRDGAMLADASQAHKLLYLGVAIAAGKAPADILPTLGLSPEILKAGNCPTFLVRAFWCTDPTTVLTHYPSAKLPFVLNLTTFRPDQVDLKAVEGALERAGKPGVLNCFRLTYGLAGGGYDKPIDSDSIPELFRLTPAHPPDAATIADLLERVVTFAAAQEGDYAVRELIDDLPLFLNRYAPALSEEDLAGNGFMQLVAVRRALMRGDTKTWQNLVQRVRQRPGQPVTRMVYDWLYSLDLEQRLLSGERQQWPGLARLHHDPEFRQAYRASLLLIDRGRLEEALSFQAAAFPIGAGDRWEATYCNIHWSLAAVRLGRWPQATRFAREAVDSARGRPAADYARMLFRLASRQDADLVRFGKAIGARQAAPGQQGLVAVARTTDDADLRSLAAFLAGRMVAATDRAEGVSREAARWWRFGADAEGAFSAWSQAALAALPAAQCEFALSTSWTDGGPMGKTFSSFDFGIGALYTGRAPSLALTSMVWVDPLGVPVFRQGGRTYYAGGGWWLYVRDSSRRWVPGQWSMIMHHAKGVEYHQRGLTRWPGGLLP